MVTLRVTPQRVQMTMFELWSVMNVWNASTQQFFGYYNTFSDTFKYNLQHNVNNYLENKNKYFISEVSRYVDKSMVTI